MKRGYKRYVEVPLVLRTPIVAAFSYSCGTLNAMRFSPRLDVLPAPQRLLWEELADVPAVFTLYGGTAVDLSRLPALQPGGSGTGGYGS